MIPVPADALLASLNKGKSSGASAVPAIPSSAITPKKLSVAFAPGQVITATASASAKLPFTVDISVPYFDADLTVDQTPALKATIQGLAVVPDNGSLNAGLDSRFAFHDSDSLTNKIGDITDAILKGQKSGKKAGVKGFTFGVSQQDSVQAFSLLGLEVPIDPLLEKKADSQTPSVMSSVATAYIDAIKIGNIDLKTDKGQMMRAAVDLGFNSHVDVTLQGLNHLAAVVGINDAAIVQANLGGLQLQPGSNQLNIKSDLRFASSRDAQIQVATLFQDFLTKDVKNLTQIIGGTGLQVGVSDSDYIKAFSKAKFGVKASQVLFKPASSPAGAFNPADLLKNLVIKENNVDMSKPGAITIDLGVSITNFTVPVAVDVGYVGTSGQLEDTHLVDVGVHKFKVAHTESSVDVNCHVQIDVHGGEQVQRRVAELASKVLTNGIQKTEMSAKAYQFVVGESKDDHIDSFSLLSAQGNPLVMMPHVDMSAATQAAGGFKLDIVYMDVLDSRRLGAEVHSHVVGLPNISLNLPYFSLAGHLDGEEFLEVEATNILVKDGNVTMNGVLMTHKNIEAAQKVAYIAGNVLFHLSQTVPNKLNAAKIRFGASKDHAFDLFELITVDAPMAPMIDGVTDVVNRPESLIALTEMKSKLVPTGISATFSGKPFPVSITVI